MSPRHTSRRRRPRGVVLLLTLVLLVILATLAYRVVSQVAARRHRVNYMIHYHKAQYACDSALKYISEKFKDIDPTLIKRPYDPDFSDIFTMNDGQYRDFLLDYIEEYKSLTEDEENEMESNDLHALRNSSLETMDLDAVEELNLKSLMDMVAVPGPYGPAWPYVIDPIIFDINSVNIKIEIEDENAKYPIGWMLLEDQEIESVVDAGFESFCEWLTITYDDIDTLRDELLDMAEIKPFKIEFTPLVFTETAPRNRSTPAGSTTNTSSGRPNRNTRTRRRTISVAEQTTRQNVDMTYLMSRGLLDLELLSRPIFESDVRKESALKYIGLYASPQVNVNTAPRHVLEAALTFGGLNKAPDIADAIIQKRKIAPFADIKDLKKALFGSADAINKCAPYITTKSAYFTIRVTATSGAARVSTLMPVYKEGRIIKKLPVING